MYLKHDKKRLKINLIYHIYKSDISALLYWTKCILKMTKNDQKNKVDISDLDHVSQIGQ